MIRRLAAVAAVIAACALIATLVGGAAFILGPLPSRRGTVAVFHLEAPVEARFDRQGVPHIRAVLELDAWRALGFVHAADRFFQMELRRRAARGRLAELFGAAAVDFDRESRVNGYLAAAQQDWELLGAGERSVLEAYADGVNAFLATESLPLEVRALSLKPAPWTPIDSLAFGRLMQNGLSAAADVERGAFDDARARGLDAAIGLYDVSQPGSSRVAPEIADILAHRARAAGAASPSIEPAFAGSNAWALAGTRTASGKPLLAGDPHLAAERPGIWYAAHLQSADGLDAVGLTLAGTPGIVIGHNGRVAWSLTMHQADDGDIYVERVNWAAGVYQRGDGWLPLRRETETIHVKDGPDVAVDIARTVHGPIVSRLDDASGLALARDFAPADLPQGPRAFLEAERATTGAELLTAWSHYAGPSVNVCWADAAGSIGVKVAGALPRRRSGDGRFPVPGWVDTYDWDGMIPAADLPAISDPRDGIVVTANDDWSSSGRSLPYPGVYADSDRAKRARQLASSLHAATVADMRAMQDDVYSAYAARIVSALRGIVLADPRAKKAMSVLARWDARAEIRGPARLFYAFMKQIRAAATPQNAPVTWSVLERMIDGSGAQQYWGERQPPDGRTRAACIESALSRAIETVERQDGPDPAHWSFGRAHHLVYHHPFASALPAWVARRLAFGPVGLPGELHTLDVAWFPLRGEGYDVTQIPSARFIVDLASPDASRLVLPLGQSGQLFDRHGSDQMNAWSTGHDFALPFTAKAVEAATISTLRLVPGN